VGDTVSGIKEQCLSSTSVDGACAASAKAGLKEHPAAIAAIGEQVSDPNLYRHSPHEPSDHPDLRPSFRHILLEGS
jgi:hypothetical protein